MYVYAGVDEAGYGPMFGPLLVGRMVLGIPQLGPEATPETIASWTGKQLWNRLDVAVCRDLAKRHGRIAVNDSKKLLGTRKGPRETAPRGSVGGGEAGDVAAAARSFDGHAHLEHLETGVLAFAALAGHRVEHVGQWLDCLGEKSHHDLTHLPWYAPTQEQPWRPLPCACTPGQFAVARNLLATAARQAGVEVLDMGAAVVFEDRFNRMVAATRSKASTSFTFVAGHLRSIWDRFGAHAPSVVVDRQSGRTHYRELLALTLPEADLTILDETPERSVYRLTERNHRGIKRTSDQGDEPRPDPSSLEGSPVRSLDRSTEGPPRSMTVSFEVDSESSHMPVALASMISKYTRELLMARFQSWFLHRAPQIKPTAGYALDARRFWEEIQPVLPSLSINPQHLARSC